jgi:N12 class adenine-specific DNA methylase
LAALDALGAAQRDGRALTDVERDVVQRWHGWGAAPQLFDRAEFARDRSRLRDLVGGPGLAAAARTTLNAHYTDGLLVDAMWDTVEALGPPGGVFLEAGCGRGTFLDRAPANWAGLGVELDPTTARVAEALVDHRHRIVTADFASVALTKGQAGAVIGNVPFGSVKLFDPIHNPGRRMAIHDHFVAKAAATLAPGGIGVVVTSRYTLDKLDDTARRAIGDHADFLGAVRLPVTAHQAEAGTSVVTDVVVLRGRAEGEPARHVQGWDTAPVTITDWDSEALSAPVRISAYYASHPEQVLGRVEMDHAMYGLEMVVTPTGDVASQLAAGLGRVVAANRGNAPGRIMAATRPAELLAVVEAAPPAPVRRIERDGDGFRQAGLRGWEDYHPPANARVELGRLVDLRDHADALVAAEGDPATPDDVLAAQRSDLAAEHRRYQSQFGPVNRVSINPESGKRTYPKMGGFRGDPGYPRVAALEIYDEALGVAQPAALLRGRVVRAAAPIERADTPADALAVSMQQLGRLDIAYVAALLDSTEEDAVAALGDRVFHDPGKVTWVTSQEYLSGNVRAKLATALAAVEDRPELAANVTALRAVQPVDVVATDLQGTLGAPWVDPRYVTEFARSLSPGSADAKASISVVRAESTGQWEVSRSSDAGWGMRIGHAFGGEKFDALRILQDQLNGRPTIITMTDPDGNKVVDGEATAAAGLKGEAISDAFDHWLLQEDPTRSAQVLDRYNRQFNSHVARNYAGMRVDPPGLRAGFQLRDHQHQAIARMVYGGGNTLLAHPVGAGKTAELIVGAMELRRLGTINLPAFVVPNHMLAQFSRDIADLYPGASVLTVDKNDVKAEHRALFAARVQSNDWDAVVITHKSFGKWPMSPAAVAGELEGRVAAMRADIARMASAGADAGQTLTKAFEKKILGEEERLKALTADMAARQDDHTFYFDRPGGVDLLLVDEAHEFKNAEVVSSARNLKGVPKADGSQMAEDLGMKLRSLAARNPGRPTAVFASGTPVSNTAAEVWIMARYLRPDLCAELGVSNFDDFRAQFCDTESAMELDVSGTSMNRVERLSRYKNLPELARMVGEFADVVRVEDLGLPRPELVGGKRRIVVIQPDQGLVDYMAITVSARADAIHSGGVDPKVDNMLKLTTDCRAVSFDWAGFSGQSIAEEHSVFAVAADEIARIYHAHAGDTYLTATGAPHPRPGAFQLVFADLGTPKPGHDDTAYDRLRGFLVARGVPATKVAFAHEHDKTDDAKARFFAMCRDGRVAVAVSSTAKMGIGTNVQDRLIGLHHLNVPWRPSDVEQREGRGLRQGNQNAGIEILAYATERSASTHGWQTVERKSGFVGQLMRADPNGPRTVDPSDDETLSYGQIKALSTGDPAFLEVADLEDRVGGLSRLERAHSQEMAALVRRDRSLTERIHVASTTLTAIAPLADRVARCDPEAAWQVEIGGMAYKNRGDAARALDRNLPRYGASRPLRFVDAKIEYGWRPGADRTEPGRLELLTTPTPGVRPTVVVVDDRSEPGLMGALARATNQVNALPSRVHSIQTQLVDLRSQLAQVQGADRSAFARHDELVGARRRLTELQAELAERYAPPPAPPPATAPGDAPNPDIIMPPGGPIFPVDGPHQPGGPLRPAPPAGHGKDMGFDR